MESETPPTELKKIIPQNHLLLFMVLRIHMETKSDSTTNKRSQIPGIHGLAAACVLQAEKQQVSLDVMIPVTDI